LFGPTDGGKIPTIVALLSVALSNSAPRPGTRLKYLTSDHSTYSYSIIDPNRYLDAQRHSPLPHLIALMSIGVRLGNTAAYDSSTQRANLSTRTDRVPRVKATLPSRRKKRAVIGEYQGTGKRIILPCFRLPRAREYILLLLPLQNSETLTTPAQG